MPEQFKSRSPKRKRNRSWVIGAIATPALIWMVWLGFFSNRSLQPEGDRLSQNENATLVPPDREPPVNNIGAIAAITGGIFLFLNVRLANRKTETANLSGADFKGKDLRGIDFSGVDLNGADLSGANLSDADLSSTDLSSTNLSGVDLSGANLSSANLSGADLISTNLKGANLSGADLRYANLSGADLRYANLSGADLRYANLSGADLNCTFLSKANFSDANLSGALLFFINSRGVLNLEPSQLKAQPSPLLCNVALPSYSSNPRVNPNRDCDRIPYVLSDRYNISLEEAQEIVNEARQHRWD